MPGFDVWHRPLDNDADGFAEAWGDDVFPDWLPEDLRGFSVVRLSQSFVNGWRKCPSSAVADKERPTYGVAAAKGIVAHAIVDARIAAQNKNDAIDNQAARAKLKELAEGGWEPPADPSFERDYRDFAEEFTKIYLAEYHRYAPFVRTEVHDQVIWDVRDEPGDVDFIIFTGSADLLLDEVSEEGELTRRICVDWKGLDVTTPIPTTNGWKRMGELQVGDRVFDQDGRPTEIAGKSEEKFLPCYAVRFRNGETIVCDEEHLWTLRDGTVVNVRDLEPGDAIGVSGPVSQGTVTIESSIHPWVLGFWLGDGNRGRGVISKSPHSRCWKMIADLGYELGAPDYGKVGADCVARTILGLMPQLRSVDQINNKHIPSDVLTWDLGDRLCLVQGLCDSDGTWNSTRGQAVWSSVDEEMADAMFSLVASLGEKPYRASVPRKGFGLEVTEHRVCWTPMRFNPFACEKGDKVVVRTTNKNSAHWVESVTEVDPRPTVCIRVDSPTSTFLCGEAMIPTHNSGQQMEEPWMIQRYGVQWRAYAVIFQLDEMHVRYPIALQKGNWIAERYKGIARVYASPEERAAYERQLIHECIPVAEAVLRTTDYSRHEIRPTNWHCSAKWCQVFARDECMGQDHPVAWISKSHQEAAKDAASINTKRREQ